VQGVNKIIKKNDEIQLV